VGDDSGAIRVWADYAEESLIGSGVVAAHMLAVGDQAGAIKYGKGSGRALGRTLSGGGLLSNVPIFKELEKCGKSLGDVIGGGDMESASKRWTKEWIEEYHDPNMWAKAGADVFVTGLTVAVGMLTGGASSIVAALGQGAIIGSTCGMLSNTSHQVIDMTVESNRFDEISGEKRCPKRESFDVSGLIGGGITGAATGAAAGAFVRAIEPTGSEIPDGFDDFRVRAVHAERGLAALSEALAEAAVESARELPTAGEPPETSSLKPIADAADCSGRRECHLQPTLTSTREVISDVHWACIHLI